MRVLPRRRPRARRPDSVGLLRAPAARWLPRRTVRLRLTLLYGALFLLAGAALLAITYTLVASTRSTATVTARTDVSHGGQQIIVTVNSFGAGAALAVPAPQQSVPGPPVGGKPLSSGSASARSSGSVSAQPSGSVSAQPSGSASASSGSASAPSSGSVSARPSGSGSARQSGSASGSVAAPSPNASFYAAGAVGPASQLPVGVTANPSVFIKEALDRERSGVLGQLLLWSGTALGIMALASVALGWWIAGRVLAPLRRMTASARQISAENLYERLAIDGPDDELKELADTFDGLLARLQGAFDAQRGAFEAQRRFVANASHELRTPLTLQRAMIEVTLADPEADASTLRAAFGRVLAAGEQQENLIEALLTLARSERGLDRREPVDLAAEVRRAMTATRRVGPTTHRARRPQITLALAPATLAGDRRLVERLAVNLLDNALRHNIADGWVEVSTETVEQCAVLRVTNSGRIIAPGDVPALMEPFRRAAPQRAGHVNGHGLGLSIAAAIAAAHDADLRINARLEGGLEIEARFPPVPTATAATATELTPTRPDDTPPAPAPPPVSPRLIAPKP
jgi:signal transduction histidine kinase